MNRNRYSAAVLALGVLGIMACNRDSERASTTYTTSAGIEQPDPVDRSHVAQPMGAIPETTVYGDPSLAGDTEATDDNGATPEGVRHLGELDDAARWTTGKGAGAARATNPFLGRGVTR